MRAAILEQYGTPLVIDEVDLAPPGPGEVRVRIRATGVCHSDLSVQAGRMPWPVPAVLGHEGAGEVVEIGPGVRSISVGDHVVISWVPLCGECFFCRRGQPQLCVRQRDFGTMGDGTSRLSRAGAPLSHGLNAATFAEEVVLREISVVRVPEDVPFEIAALVGCGVLTGVGAAVNTAKIEPGERVAVIGCGGVGLNVVQGCRVAGASTIVAIDPVESKREAALRFGATHAAAPDEAPGLLASLTGGVGPDAVFEVAGRPELQRQAWDLARAGGRAVMVGVPGVTEETTLPSLLLTILEKKILGCSYGSSDPRRDVGRILDLWRAGRLDLEGLISHRLPLDGVNDAFGAMEAGTAIRSVLLP
ncbi:MAG: Zn-dependent alcohol dehydrogenase [Acidobacteria bacterium]|nr:Zn-dependent alcohol dehydrogenase [Acidobacteriota bacterium]